MLMKHVDWELRLGLIFCVPLVFIAGGCKGIYNMFKDFWNEGTDI